MAKALIQQSGQYSLFMSVQKVEAVPDTFHVVFSSTFGGAKDPGEERKVHEMFLSSEAVDKMKVLLDT